MINFLNLISIKPKPLVILLALCVCIWSEPAPDLPGEEVTETESSLKKSESQVTELSAPKPPKKNKWQAPSINEQLARDKTLIGMGYGALFVPTMSEPRLEPEVIVYKGDDKLTPGQPGERILLEEGSYLIRIGSGTLDQKMKYLVSIKEGKTTIVKPEWSGLVVEVLDENGDYKSHEYDLFSMNNSEPLGKGYGLEEERIKDLRTWILKPGLYKITKVGESFGSVKNYITVQLNPGELTVVELVYSEEGELIAGGVKDVRARRQAGVNWKYGARIGGNVSLNNKIINFEETSRTVSALLDFKFRAKYDNTKYFGINELRTKNIFQWEKNEDVSSVTDEIRIRSSWVRRLNKYVGPYLSAKVESHFFPQYQAIASENDTAFIKDEDGEYLHYITQSITDGAMPRQDFIVEGDTITSLRGKNLEEFEITPSIFPLLLGAGGGANFELITNYNFEFSTQLGLGVRQTYTRDQLSRVSETRNIWAPLPSKFEVGLENTINSRLRLGSRLTVDLQTELFFENGNPYAYKVEEFLTDVRFNITRYLELSYLFEMNDKLSETGRSSPLRFEYENGILLRISINI